jgi:hypothetical protein
MLFGTATYTVMIFGLDFVLLRGGEIYFLPENAVMFMSPNEKAKRAQNGKWVSVSEHMLIVTLSSAKFAMWAIYTRITYVVLALLAAKMDGY